MVLSPRQNAVLSGLRRHGAWVREDWVAICHGLSRTGANVVLQELRQHGLVEQASDGLWRAA